jgi:hypothetical protein
MIDDYGAFSGMKIGRGNPMLHLFLTAPRRRTRYLGSEGDPLYLYMLFLMYQLTKQFYIKQINTIILVFVYCVEVLMHVSTLSGHHQAIIT